MKTSCGKQNAEYKSFCYVIAFTKTEKLSDAN